MTDQDRKSRAVPRRRRWPWVSAAVVAGLLFAAGGLWLGRIPLAEWGIARTMGALGYGPVDLTVTRLDFTATEVVDLRFASGTIDRIALNYDLAALSAGKIARMEITGADLHLAWADGGPDLPAGSTGGATSPVLPVQVIYVRRSTVRLETPSLVTTIAFDGSVTAHDTFAVDFKLTAESMPVGATRDADGKGTGAADLAAPAATISFHARAADREGRIDYRLDGEVRTETLATFMTAGTVIKGVVRFDLSGRTPRIPSPRALAGLSPLQWLAESQLDGTIELALDRIAHPALGTAQGLAGTALLHADPGGFALSIPAGFSVSALRLKSDLFEPDAGLGRILARAGAIDLALHADTDAPLLRVLPRPGTVTAHLATGFSMTGTNISVRGRANGTLEPDVASRPPGPSADRRGSFVIDARAAVRIGDLFSAGAVSAQLDGRYRFDAAALRLDQVAGRLAVRDFELDGRLAVLDVAGAVLDPGRTKLKFDRVAEVFTGSVTLMPLSMSGTFRARAGESLPVRATARSLSFTLTPRRQEAVLEDGRVVLPAHDVSVAGVTAVISRSAGIATLDIGVAELSHTADPPFFGPLKSDIQVRADPDRVKFSASLHDPDGLLSVRLTGQHMLRAGRGQARVALEPLKLGPGPEGIKKLFPAVAAGITSAQGTVSLAGAMAWNSGTTTANFDLDFKDIAVSSGSFGLSALNGTVHFDGFAPPTTPPAQHLAAVADFPLFGAVPLDLTFRLEPGRVVFERATASVLGGRIEVHETAFDAAMRRGQIDLRIIDVDLAAISKLIDLEAVEGTGTLSGVLPIQFESGRIAIANGRLAASKAGTVRLALPFLADQFEGRGDTVDLALRALSDFRYQRFTLDINKPFEGEGAVTVHLEGANPATLEGHPFVFNIRLTANFERLARLVAEASAMAGRALDWGARSAGP